MAARLVLPRSLENRARSFEDAEDHGAVPLVAAWRGHTIGVQGGADVLLLFAAAYHLDDARDDLLLLGHWLQAAAPVWAAHRRDAVAVGRPTHEAAQRFEVAHRVADMVLRNQRNQILAIRSKQSGYVESIG